MFPNCDVLRSLTGYCRIDLFCGYASMYGQGGFTLDPDTVARIAQLGVSLGPDFYPPDRSGVNAMKIVNN
jgi:hypothetical protein